MRNNWQHIYTNTGRGQCEHQPLGLCPQLAWRLSRELAAVLEANICVKLWGQTG